MAELDDVVTERIWRDGSGPNPDIVLSFDNTSGVVLEEGPVVYDDDSYAGESMMPYTTRGHPCAARLRPRPRGALHHHVDGADRQYRVAIGSGVS